MDNIKNDYYYLDKVIRDFHFIMKHTKDVSKDEFEKNEILLDSMMFRFIQISEHMKKLSTTFRANHVAVPWNEIIGLRNRIVHEYANVDYNIIYNTVKNDVLEIVVLLESIMNTK